MTQKIQQITAAVNTIISYGGTAKHVRALGRAAKLIYFASNLNSYHKPNRLRARKAINLAIKLASSVRKNYKGVQTQRAFSMSNLCLGVMHYAHVTAQNVRGYHFQKAYISKCSCCYGSYYYNHPTQTSRQVNFPSLITQQTYSAQPIVWGGYLQFLQAIYVSF